MLLFRKRAAVTEPLDSKYEKLLVGQFAFALIVLNLRLDTVDNV